MNIPEYNFKLVCEINPDVQNGRIFKYNPKDAYENYKGLRLNKYGNEMFCRFKIPRDLPYEGVYYLAVNEKVMYVGECVNLSQRYNMGYGNISPRNVYKGGQSTNCKVNANILKVVESGGKIYLYFYQTNDRHNVESALVNAYQPAWNSKQIYYKKNVTAPSAESQEHNLRRNTGMGKISKYHGLYVYLSKREEEIITLTHEDIEHIIGDKLPMSAYTYDAWWASGKKSHYYASYWLDAGYKASLQPSGDRVVFKRYNTDGNI